MNANLSIKYKDPLGLKPDARNARTHDSGQISQIIASIQEFGFTNPVLIDERDGIIAGHGRQVAAINMEMPLVPTICLAGLSDAQRRAYVIADNKIALNGGWDYALLGMELESLEEMTFDVALTGFHPNEIDRVRKGVDGQTHEDSRPQLPENPFTKLGDVIRLGDHRLMCGDCRSEREMKKLIGPTTKINVVVTSPPYASQRKYDEQSGFEPVPPNVYPDWFEAVQCHIAKHLADDGSFFLNIKEHCDDGQRLLYVKDLTLAFVRRWAWRFIDEYAWTHGGTPKGITRRFKNGWEPVFHFTKHEHKFRPDAVMHQSNSAVDWSGGHPADDDGRRNVVNIAPNRDETKANGEIVGGFAYPSNVLRIGKNTESMPHGALFPVSLPEFFIRAYSDKHDSVLDPFAGAGTTMIAAEKQSRKSFSMEISPAYCDVAIGRWEQFTGKKARR